MTDFERNKRSIASWTIALVSGSAFNQDILNIIMQ